MLENILLMDAEEYNCELPAEMKATLDERLQEDEKTYLTAGESISQLNKKYGL